MLRMPEVAVQDWRDTPQCHQPRRAKRADKSTHQTTAELEQSENKTNFVTWTMKYQTISKTRSFELDFFLLIFFFCLVSFSSFVGFVLPLQQPCNKMHCLVLCIKKTVGVRMTEWGGAGIYIGPWQDLWNVTMCTAPSSEREHKCKKSREFTWLQNGTQGSHGLSHLFGAFNFFLC